MSNSWPVVCLGDVLPLKYGKNLPEGVRINNGNIPVVSSAGVVGWHNDYVSDGPVVVVGRKGSVGNLTFLDGPAWPIDTAFYIEGNEHIDVQFAYYLMQTLPFRSMNNDSAVPGLNRTEAESLSIRLPDPVSQGSIVSVLSALDDKIAANRCLESAIDSLLGAQVSSMWKTAEKVPLGEQLRLHYGKALPVSQRAEGAAVVVGSGGVVGSHNEELISGPAVIVGRKGTVGATYWIAGGSYPIDTTFWVEPTGAPLAYLYYLLKSIDFVSMSSDSAVPGLNRNRAYATEVPRVSASDLETFESASSGLMRKLEASQSENRTLAATRDELLPLLMSGRITVKDAERRVEQEV